MIPVVVFLIINKEGKVLVEQRLKDEVSALAGHFLFPGGGAKEEEMDRLEVALLRELKEELGIVPQEYFRLETNEVIKGIGENVTLNPFFISKWEGKIPERVLDEGDLLSWVELEFMLHSPIEPTRKIAQALQKYLQTVSKLIT